MENTKKYNYELVNLVIISFVVLAFTYTVLSHIKTVVADEGFHNPQIWAFFHGHFTPSEHITVPPTYHALIAALLKIFGFFSTELARFVHLLVCSLLVPVLYMISRHFEHKNNDYRVLLFLTMPIVLPFFSILYTDIPALLLVSLSFLFTVKKRYILASLAGAVAIAMRQPNVIWVAFCASFVLADFFMRDGWRNPLSLRGPEVFRLLPRVAPYGLVIVTALFVFYLRKNVAVGDTSMHQVTLNLSNLYMFLLLSFLFFLPYHVVYFPRIIRCLSNSYAVWVLLFLGLVVYAFTYSNSHPYNTIGLAHYYRNVVLHYTVTITWLKFLVFMPMAISAFTYYFFWKDSKASDKTSLLLIYVFGLISFVPLPMVEPRYYLTALALIAVSRPSLRSDLDLGCLFMYIPLSGLLLFLISNSIIFI